MRRMSLFIVVAVVMVAIIVAFAAPAIAVDGWWGHRHHQPQQFCNWFWSWWWGWTRWCWSPWWGWFPVWR